MWRKGPLSTSPRLHRHASSFTIRKSRGAPRDVPTPLVFCSARQWLPEGHVRSSIYSTSLLEKGFTCIETDFEHPRTQSSVSTSKDLMERLSNELKTNLLSSDLPFPPVIFANGFASFVAQTYISSNPAQGLFLISPPSDANPHPNILPTPLPKFNYELKFPMALMALPEEMVVLKARSRFTTSDWVDVIEVDNLEGEQALAKIEQWLDELGV
ncbi:hypothetical protein F5I97DRAFT_1814327 [Phlebopus sp. FC_14]|nr:hypothetical protein F5I97DRAFT_1814327 [Phlebopus sp. FC_14]